MKKTNTVKKVPITFKGISTSLRGVNALAVRLKTEEDALAKAVVDLRDRLEGALNLSRNAAEARRIGNYLDDLEQLESDLEGDPTELVAFGVLSGKGLQKTLKAIFDFMKKNPQLFR